MADSMKKNYKVSGSGVLTIDGDALIIAVEDKGEFNLANVLSDLNDHPVKFSFSYDEEYETDEDEVDVDIDFEYEVEVEIDEETGEVI
jgi:hypothetical protein